MASSRLGFFPLSLPGSLQSQDDDRCRVNRAENVVGQSISFFFSFRADWICWIPGMCPGRILNHLGQNLLDWFETALKRIYYTDLVII